MLIVHHLENSRSQRILWLLEEMGVGYEIKSYQRDKETSLAPMPFFVKPIAKGIAAKIRENYAGYLDRIRARPAYKAAVEKGGPYALLSINKK